MEDTNIKTNNGNVKTNGSTNVKTNGNVTVKTNGNVTPIVNMQPEETQEHEDLELCNQEIMIGYLRKICTGIESLAGTLQSKYDQKGRDARKRGRALVYKFDNYYDITNIIKISAPENPNDPDSPVYNVEPVYIKLERYSDICHVINLSNRSLFVVISHRGKTDLSKETEVVAGEIKPFYNVYELRIRGPEKGLKYRVTEYPSRNTWLEAFLPVELVSITDESLPEHHKNWLHEDIIPIQTPTTFRIQVSVSVSGIFSAVVTNTIGDKKTEVVEFNIAGNHPELIANGLFAFEMLVRRGDTINFKYSVSDGKIKLFTVQEIDAATG